MDFGRLVLILFLSATLFFKTTPVVAGDDTKVSLALYYESLCPYSANFIVNYLAKIFENGIIDIVDLDLVPYGNARLKANGTITCQHGPNECLLNTVEACAISAWPDLTEHFKFIYCVENLVFKHKYKQWESCFLETGLNSEAVSDCYNSGYGNKLELKYAAQTDALQPPHTYVPWVVVNGQPLYDDYENFEVYICNAYEGNSPPKSCNGLTGLTTKAAGWAQHVSFVDEVFWFNDHQVTAAA
ncbi:gamma-interferon-inducible lysosomal thiol reductase-like [Phalaenopsis equestris]|uniref:gamma-interferon-inducible lysosomal thiol reductase-like n=1 Tax=Phalaenopsis equestris TaxID=78828 RepID=UPI0009E34A1B|nr:gamma-interferon-inducible lysosomal thiol reductase-like [Phalaenopsis equestris]